MNRDELIEEIEAQITLCLDTGGNDHDAAHVVLDTIAQAGLAIVPTRVVDALDKIAAGETTVFDEGEGRDVTVPMSAEEMSGIARAARQEAVP